MTYGSKGHALDDKKIIIGLTAGSTNEDYSKDGKIGIMIEENSKPYLITFDYCWTNIIGTAFTGEILNTENSSADEQKKLEKQAKVHSKLIKLIENR